MRRATEAKTEGQVWEVINKDRKKKKVVNERIEMEEWGLFYGIIVGSRDKSCERSEEEKGKR